MPKRSARVAVVGGRQFNNYALLSEVVGNYHEQYGIEMIVSGGAKGADTLAEKWARENEVDLMICLPKWKEHGRPAGIFRNRKIVYSSDCVIAFPTKNSVGTWDTIRFAQKRNKPVYAFDEEGNRIDIEET